MESITDNLIEDIESLQEIKENIINSTNLLIESNIEMTTSELEEIRQANEFQYYYAEIIQAIIDRKQDILHILNGITEMNEDLQAENKKLLEQIHN